MEFFLIESYFREHLNKMTSNYNISVGGDPVRPRAPDDNTESLMAQVKQEEAKPSLMKVA